MTPRQSEVLDFIEKWWATHSYAPSYQEIADGLGIGSKSTVHKVISNLRRDGWIHAASDRQRTIRSLRRDPLPKADGGPGNVVGT